jgi:molybdopterin synthase catalytic subunit
MSLFDLRDTPLSVDEVTAAVQRGGAGGTALFIGTVRDENDGRAVSLLEYEAYPSMARSEMAAIGAELAQEIPGVRLAAVHRIGKLGIGDIAIVCAASAPHRGEAFRACRALIDRIKERVTVWKREHGPDGPYWVGWQDARCVGHDERDQHGHHGHHGEEHAHVHAPGEHDHEH